MPLVNEVKFIQVYEIFDTAFSGHAVPYPNFIELVLGFQGYSEAIELWGKQLLAPIS